MVEFKVLHSMLGTRLTNLKDKTDKNKAVSSQKPYLLKASDSIAGILVSYNHLWKAIIKCALDIGYHGTQMVRM